MTPSDAMNHKSGLVLFLDLDDVLCLKNPYSGYDVRAALGKVQMDQAALADYSELWGAIFAPEAKEFLKDLHFEFKLTYVLSTSWRLILNRPALSAVLTLSGLECVAENLHADWRTPSISPAIEPRGRPISATRAQEIGAWLESHPEFVASWYILDDSHSGSGLLHWPTRAERQFIHLCQPTFGLTEAEFVRLREAFNIRLSSKRNGKWDPL